MEGTTTPTTVAASTPKDFLELVKLSKEIESIISNDTLPLLTESIDEPNRHSIFYNTRHDSSFDRQDNRPRSRKSLYGDDYDVSDDYSYVSSNGDRDLTMGGGGVGNSDDTYYWDGLGTGNGGFTMVQTSQFLMDQGIKPRDLMESTETILEFIRETATIRSASLSLSSSSTSSQPLSISISASLSNSEQSAASDLSMSRAVRGLRTSPESTEGNEGGSDSLTTEVKRRVRGRILEFDEYISAQRSAIQEYVTSFSLRTVNDMCAERCQNIADDSWDGILKKFSGEKGKGGISSYLDSGSALMMPPFSPAGGPIRRQIQKLNIEHTLEEKIKKFAEDVENACRNEKTFLEVLGEKKDSGYSLDGMQGIWTILKGMFCPPQSSGGAGARCVNSKTLYDNTMALLGKYFEGMKKDKALAKKVGGNSDISEYVWQNVYYAMLCNNYEEAISCIRSKDINFSGLIRPNQIADVFDEFYVKKSLS